MSRKPLYSITLSESERQKLKRVWRNSNSSSTIKKRLAIVLEADRTTLSQKQIAQRLGVAPATVSATIRLFATKGLEGILTFKRSLKSDCANLKVTGAIEAKIIAKACLEPPEGTIRWTVSILCEECNKQMNLSLSRSTYHRVLLRNELHPHLNKYWSIPPKESGEFCACMEDVLDLYEAPTDSNTPLVCMDEKPKEIHGYLHSPLPTLPHKTRIEDSEYVRKGHASVFVFVNPDTGWIGAHASLRRTRKDWAQQIKWLVDEVYPDAKKIRLVMDNLNTHTPGSLYETFEPEVARRIADKLEIHYTPKHGSWLNIAEIAIHIISKECLNRRIESFENLDHQIKCWCDRRDNTKAIKWKFTTEDARIKLHHLYPKLGQ